LRGDLYRQRLAALERALALELDRELGAEVR
jgi:hypothetical protein